MCIVCIQIAYYNLIPWKNATDSSTFTFPVNKRLLHFCCYLLTVSDICWEETAATVKLFQPFLGQVIQPFLNDLSILLGNSSKFLWF